MCAGPRVALSGLKLSVSIFGLSSTQGFKTSLHGSSRYLEDLASLLMQATPTLAVALEKLALTGLGKPFGSLKEFTGL